MEVRSVIAEEAGRGEIEQSNAAGILKIARLAASYYIWPDVNAKTLKPYIAQPWRHGNAVRP